MAPQCDDDDDDYHDDARGGVPACLDEVRHCHHERDGETTPVTRVVTQRYGDRNPSTTPSLVSTDSGRSGFPSVPSFLMILVLRFKGQ